MTNTDYPRYGERGVPEFAYDPVTQPELFAGVRSKRIMAFLVDLVIVLLLTFAAGVVVFLLGIVTFGLAWLLYGGLFPVIAVVYTAITLGGPQSATVGMRAAGIEMRLWHGARMYHLIAAMHVLVFYFSVSIATPLILLVSLFNARKRCVHDMLMGTIAINALPERRADIA